MVIATGSGKQCLRSLLRRRIMIAAWVSILVIYSFSVFTIIQIITYHNITYTNVTYLDIT